MQSGYQSSRSIPMKIKEEPRKNMKTYSLSAKLFDPEPSPPVSDFMKRLIERNEYYNMSENCASPPRT